MPEQALAKTIEGFFLSTMMENTSESSIIPFLMCSQVVPPSGVFQARCQVPAYTILGFCGSTAMDSTFFMSAWLGGEMRCQLLPPSLLRYTPSSAPATRTLGSDGETARARTDLPCMAGRVSQFLPPSWLRKMSPVCWL